MKPPADCTTWLNATLMEQRAGGLLQRFVRWIYLEMVLSILAAAVMAFSARKTCMCCSFP